VYALTSLLHYIAVRATTTCTAHIDRAKRLQPFRRAQNIAHVCRDAAVAVAEPLDFARRRAAGDGLDQSRRSTAQVPWPDRPAAIISAAPRYLGGGGGCGTDGRQGSDAKHLCCMLAALPPTRRLRDVHV